MKKIQVLTLVGFLFLTMLSVNVNSQNYQNADTPYQKEVKKGAHFGVSRDSVDWLINRPKDNWFITPALGATMYIGNAYEPDARFNKVRPIAQLGIGKWLIPDVAIEFNIQGTRANSQSRYNLNPYVNFTDSDSYKDEDGVTRNHYKSFDFNYLSFNGIVDFDWTNYFRGYAKGKTRCYHFITQLGLGLNYGWGKIVNERAIDRREEADYPTDVAHNFEINGMFAINNQFRLSDRVDLNVILRSNITRGSFDDYYGAEDHIQMSWYKRRFDFIPSAMVGLTFNMGNFRNIRHEFIDADMMARAIANQMNNNNGGNGGCCTDTAVANAIREATKAMKDRDSVLNELIKEIKEDRENANRNNGKGSGDMSDNIPAQVISEIDKRGLKAVYTNFQINKAVVDPSDMSKLKDMAEYIKNDPENGKYLIIGSADSRTGTEEINQRLSEKRCQAVYDLFVNKFGVPSDRLIKKPLGGIDDYEPFEINRLCIIVGEDPAMMDLIDLKRKQN